MMKLLVSYLITYSFVQVQTCYLQIFVCLVGMAMAAPYYPYYAAYGPADLLPATAGGLVRHPNGALVPAQTPSVAAARAAHLGGKFGGYHPLDIHG